MSAELHASLSALYNDHGAHLTHCLNKPGDASHKGALGQSFKYDRPPLSKILREVEKGALPGWFPASCGIVAFDLDSGGRAALDKLKQLVDARPLLVLPSAKPERFHVYFLCPDAAKVADWDWSLDGGEPKCGELRATGNLVLHGNAGARLVQCLANGHEPGAAIPTTISPKIVCL